MFNIILKLGRTCLTSPYGPAIRGREKGDEIMLPMLLRVRVRNSDTRFGFFFPMLLLYILLLPVIIITAVVYTFMLTVPHRTKQARSYMKFVLHSPQLLSAARGIEIDVSSDDSDIKMYLK